MRRWVLVAAGAAALAGIGVAVARSKGGTDVGLRRSFEYALLGVPHGPLGRVGVRMMAARKGSFYRAMAAELDLRPDDALLDVGCGSGRIIQDLPEAIGMDILLPKLRFLHERHPRVLQGDIFALPFPDNVFGAVICSEVIEHVPDRSPLFEELTRVLRPGGTLILGTPDYGRRLWWVLEWIYGKVLPGAYAHEHITHYTRASLIQRMLAHGFTIRNLQYVGFCEMIFQARKASDR